MINHNIINLVTIIINHNIINLVTIIINHNIINLVTIIINHNITNLVTIMINHNIINLVTIMINHNIINLVTIMINHNIINLVTIMINHNITRCRPSKGRRCIPDVDIWVHVETYLNVDLSSSAQVKIQVKFNYELFWKKNQIFCVVVLVKTFPLTYQLLM